MKILVQKEGICLTLILDGYCSCCNLSEFNPRPNDKISNWSKLKGEADDKIKVIEKFE